MGTRSAGFRVASVVWAIVIGGGIMFLAGSVLLPSTKRARVDFDKMRPTSDEIAPPPATTPAATEPALGPPPVSTAPRE